MATIAQIQERVAASYRLRVRVMWSDARGEAAGPRQIAMFIARDLTGQTYADIGRAFGGRHYSTVMHAVDSVNARMLHDETFRETVRDLVTSLEAQVDVI